MLSLIFVLFAGRMQAPAQAPAQAPSSIQGVVVKLGTGEPLPNVSVQLNLESNQQDENPPRPREDFHRNAKTDRDGRFSFANVAPGTYRLIATSETGYAPAEYGQRSPTGEGISFAIAAGQRMTGVQLAMAPTGSISGRVYDKNGEPLGNALVMAMRPVYKDGTRALTIVQSVATDDRGAYRLFWLAPGNYYVAAKPDIAEIAMNPAQPNSGKAAAVRITPPMRFGTFEQATAPSVRTRRLKTGELVEEMYRPVYYPGAAEAQSATAISLSAGAEAGGVDLTTEAGLIRARHIRGRIIDGATGQPAANASVSAVPRTNDPYVTIASARSDVQGLFDVAGVAAGAYQVFVTRYGEGVPGLNGVLNVEVSDRDIDNLSIVAAREFKLAGRFIMENGSRSYPRVGELVRDPLAPGMPHGGPNFNPPAAADGSFTLDGVATGDFRVTVRNLPPDGYIQSMRLGNVDVLDDGLHIFGPPEGVLEIVIGANAGHIDGLLVDVGQQALANRTVALVPDVRLRQRSDLYKVASTDAAGHFRMQNVTPGEYKLFAWDNVEPGAWQDPGFIGAYENAGRPVHIYEGASESVQLQVIP